MGVQLCSLKWEDFRRLLQIHTGKESPIAGSSSQVKSANTLAIGLFVQEPETNPTQAWSSFTQEPAWLLSSGLASAWPSSQFGQPCQHRQKDR
jgi:hypothetical protein